MLSESQIELKAQQYLQRLEQKHEKKQNLLKQLEAKVNNAAKRIQRAWKKYLIKKKKYYALKIQKAWRIYRLRFQVYREKINKFRKVFFGAKIAWFIFKKYFNHKRQKSELKTNQKIQSTFGKFRISQKIVKNFAGFINLSQTYAAESSYIQKLRVYEKARFSQSWQSYEQKLKKQLQKQAGKKWVKKNQTTWISQQNKEINLEEYIEKHVQKIFEREYNKYKEADKKLQNTSIILKQKIHQFTIQYYRTILQENVQKK